jgi:hypothetical protein
MPYRDGARLQPPDLSQAGATTTEQAASVFPAAIPRFNQVKDRIDAGGKPTPLLEGAEWLQRKHYQSVLYLKRPGEDDSVDRDTFQARGLKYYSLDVSPETLAAKLEEFNKIVGEAGNLPLFVYDKDGSLAGALWYLHFRTVDKRPDAQALQMGTQLGLKKDGTDENVRLWLATQKYLEKPGP